ncbi:NAD(P)/FAD-dependent oxidoreductase [Phormidium tenue FACHB-886]|nr:NAD(P)/FAD-dependent oxidoreductase [Phormidium tenue FACHB-886]
MSRSSLIHLLRQSYRASQISNKTQVPIAEVAAKLRDLQLPKTDPLEASRSAHVSRRQVLNGIAATGLLSLTPMGRQHLIAARTAADPKILVVGAGVAGLTVAYRLQQAGVAVDLVEASRRVGGRLRSLNGNAVAPGVVELGGEFIDSRHTAVRSLAAELGLKLADLRAADAGLDPEILYFQGQKISHEQVAANFAPLAKRVAEDLSSLGSREITYHAPSPDAVRLDRQSLAAYLDATPLDPVINQLVRVAYITEFGRDAESQSCLNMLFLIGSEVGKWSTYGISDERYHVVGGNERIPQALATQLGSEIETETALESIRMTPAGRYRVSLRQGGTSLERVYEEIVLTLPFSILRQVELAIDLPPVKQQAIAELGYGTCSKLAIPFRERLWRSRYGSTISIYTDLDFQNTWESARYSTLPSGWVTDLRGGKGGVWLGANSPAHHAQALTTNLELLFPGISQVEQGQAVRAVWAADPYALGSYSCYLPGQWTAIGGAEGERVGNLWFAGEHCSAGSQGYMNGACETAEAVAKGILQQLGSRRFA